jgi:hypothetical protein
LTPKFVEGTSDLISEAGELLTPDMVKYLKDLLTELDKSMPQITSLIAPDSIKKISGLLTNAEDLLTAKFVNETSTLIADVSGLFPLLEGILNSL